MNQPDHKLSLHLKNFNEKVKLMNQTNGKSLTLDSLEARNLHNDIFALLAQIAELSQKKDNSQSVIDVAFHGGKF